MEQASLSSIIIKYSVAFLMVIIILISVLGNLLVCLAICIERKLRNSGAGNFFLISLVSEMIFDKWVFGQILCRIWISCDVMCCTSSILNLCAICIDRFLHIKDPYNYNNYMSRKVVVLIIFLIWLVSATISFVPLNMGWHKLDIFLVQPHETSSNNIQLNNDQIKLNKLISNSIDQEDEDNSKCDLGFSPLYAVLSSCISFYLPSIVMVALYIRLYLFARKHVRDIRKQCKPQLITQPKRDITRDDSPLKSNNLLTCPNQGSNRSNRSCKSAAGNTPTTQLTQQQRTTTVQQHVADHKAAITIGIILSAFLLCWLPFFLMNIYLSFCTNCVSENAFLALTWLGWCNSALNPIIYTIFNREFRAAFIKLLTTWPAFGSCSLLKLKHRFSANTAQQQQASNIQHPLKHTASSECSQLANNLDQQNIQSLPHQNVQQYQNLPQQQQHQNIQQSSSINKKTNNLPNSSRLAKMEIIQLRTNEDIKKQTEHFDNHQNNEEQNKNNNIFTATIQQTKYTTITNNIKLNNSNNNNKNNKNEQKMMMVSITNSNSKDAVISNV